MSLGLQRLVGLTQPLSLRGRRRLNLDGVAETSLPGGIGVGALRAGQAQDQEGIDEHDLSSFVFEFVA